MIHHNVVYGFIVSFFNWHCFILIFNFKHGIYQSNMAAGAAVAKNLMIQTALAREFVGNSEWNIWRFRLVCVLSTIIEMRKA